MKACENRLVFSYIDNLLIIIKKEQFLKIKIKNFWALITFRVNFFSLYMAKEYYNSLNCLVKYTFRGSYLD